MHNIEKEIFTLTASELIVKIESIVQEKRITYMDAVLLFCETTGIEIESVASIIKSSPKLKVRIQEDAEQLNYLPKTRRIFND